MKKILRSIGSFFERLFLDTMAFAKKFARPAVLVVEALKEIAESPLTGAVVKLTSTKVDDRWLARARVVLPEIFHMLQLTNDCVVKGKTNDEIIQCVLAKIKLMHPNAQKSTWLSIAGHLSADFSDGKFSFGEMVGLAWYVYEREYNGRFAVAA